MSVPKRSRELILLVGLATLLTPAFGQRGGSTGSPPSGGGTTTGGGGTTQPGAGQPNSRSTQPPASTQGPNQPVFLSGRVMLEDGAPPPEPIAIQLVCGGSPYTEGYTNRQGDFSITLGASPATAQQDASSNGFPDTTSGSPGTLNGNNNTFSTTPGLSDRPWAYCDIRAQLAGYQSQSVSLMNRRAMDDPNVGTILLHRIGQSEGTMVSATTLAAPKSARKAYEKALELVKKKKFDDAQASLTKAVEEYPRYAAAWSELGMLEASKGDTATAQHAFDQAIQADPKYVPPYVEMSLMELRAHQWQAVSETSEKALRLDPFNYPQAYFFNAMAHYNLQQMDAAEESARRAQKLDTRHQIPEVSHLISVILAARHDYQGAAVEMRDYLKFAPQAEDAADARSQLERFEKLIAANPSKPAQ
ncbi:MAG TPA: tetratricopeptide repeat protein [Bryobacteraceae bacterium]|jgi:tetratricopeptide (TPR) repeat protein|nr:tetratricopeptide repeat protein [Bryobacteraceae bacterium]